VRQVEIRPLLDVRQTRYKPTTHMPGGPVSVSLPRDSDTRCHYASRHLIASKMSGRRHCRSSRGGGTTCSVISSVQMCVSV